MPGRLGFGTYLKAAFKNRWNMLLLGTAAAFALIGGPRMDIYLPIVAAAEISFVTAMAVNKRFQRVIESRLLASESSKSIEAMTRKFNKLFYALDLTSQERFNELRARCEVLREISLAHADENASETEDKLSESQMNGVNRLLWVYLKLLYTQVTLERFFKSTNEREIEQLVVETRRQIEALPKDDQNEIAIKKRRSLEDTLETATSRKLNLKRATDNYEYVGLELKRIATKLTALSELAVNRQDPGTISSEVDHVADSVESTEQTIGELQVFNGLSSEDDEAPPILTRMPQRVRA